MAKTIESKVSKTILQQPMEIQIGEKKYSVAPPSTATLILASEAISKLPSIQLDMKNIASESLYIAKDCEALGEIIAILILGAKRIKETQKRFFGLKTVEVDRKAVLAKEILAELPPNQIGDVLGKILEGMRVDFFFSIINSLIEINLLRKTREMVTTTTASGR